MLQLNTIRQNPEMIIERLAIKNFDASLMVQKILDQDENRRKTQKQLDDLLSASNNAAKEIGALYQSGKQDEANELKGKTVQLKKQSKELEEQLKLSETVLNDLLVLLPNLPHVSVGAGISSEENEIIYSEGEALMLPDNHLPHWELGHSLKLFNFETGSKISAAGFPVYMGKGAKLQRALISFFLDNAIAAGYTEIQPPLLVNEASAFATGQLPDKDGQMYFTGGDGLYLIPTAEVPVTNIYRDLIIKETDLPLKNAAHSACFRREAGSYGKDVRGLNRLHQFDKVEIVQVAHPDKSYQVLEEMKDYVSGLLRKLELPFRIARLCGGDLSFTSALTYDMEVWSGVQKKWLEVSSISNFESFQTNRMKLRFKTSDGKMILAHTLNGSALALPRIMAALIENNQENGSIRIPSALVPYTGFDKIVPE